jgi:hypothetical protein
MCRAKCGSYTRDWRIQVKKWWGWRTIHTGYMEPAEAQEMLDRLMRNNGSWEILYPTQKSCRIVEADGAFTCIAHKKTWGAISKPDTPCAGFIAPKEPPL